MTVINGSFETGGVTPGQASGWTLTSSQAGEDTASFAVFIDGLQTQSGAETFAWSRALAVLDDEVTELFTLDDGTAAESFETGWQNTVYLPELGDSVAFAPFDSTLDPVENFEAEWSANESFFFALSDVTATPAQFDAALDDVEDFEHEWSANESFWPDLAAVTTATAQFDPEAPEAFEDFEEYWPTQVMATL